MAEPFPYCVIEELATVVDTIPVVQAVLKRPLRVTDPHNSVGIFSADWRPGQMQIGQSDPALAKYEYLIQVLAKHANEEEGRKDHALLTKSIRTMVYRSTDLKLRFAQLSDSSLGVTERFQKCGVRAQRFISNELDQQFLFVSSTELWVEVEQV